MIELVHIVAPSHSGSTLLTLLSTSHPAVTSMGELKANLVGDVKLYRCSCGEPITACGYWKDIARRMAQRGLDFDITRAGLHFRIPDDGWVDRLARLDHGGWLFERLRDLGLGCSRRWRAHCARILHETLNVIEVVCEANNAHVFVDSSKHAVRLKYLRPLKLDLRALHLVRDGRGVAHTYISQRDYSMELAAREWLRGQRSSMRALSGLHPNRVLRIHYEALCSDTAATMQRVFAFMGLDAAAAAVGFAARAHHVVGNSMRLGFSGQIELDDRWQRELTSEQLSTFDRVCGRLNRKYGYQ